MHQRSRVNLQLFVWLRLNPAFTSVMMDGSLMEDGKSVASYGVQRRCVERSR